jgi:hypothetical protein
MEIFGRDGRMLAAQVEQKNGMTKDDRNGVPDAGNLPVRFDVRDMETEPWWNY